MLSKRVILMVALGASAGFSVQSRAAGEVRLVSETRGRLVVDIHFDESGREGRPVIPYLNGPGEPPIHYERFFVAVQDPHSFSARVIDGVSEDASGDLPEPVQPASDGRIAASVRGGFYPASPCLPGAAMVFRKTRVIPVDCFSEQVDYNAGIRRRWSWYRLEVRFNDSPGTAGGAVRDPILSALVINGRTLPAPASAGLKVNRRRASAAASGFDLSDNWVRIRIQSRGIYAISGADLAALGLNISAIDPGSLRLFTLGGLEQPQSLSDLTGTWRPENWLNECAIIFEGSGVGDVSFDPDDQLLFYGLGSRDWLDLYSPGAAWEDFQDHLYSSENEYFLTWGGSFGGLPRRMATVEAAPLSGAPEYYSYEKRDHYEQDEFEDFDFGDDGWYWYSVNRGEGPLSVNLINFSVTDLIPAVPQQFRTIAIAPYCATSLCRSGGLNNNHHPVYLVNGLTVVQDTFSVTYYNNHYSNGRFLQTGGAFLHEGLNSFALGAPRDLNPQDFFYFAWFDIVYERRLKAMSSILAFSSPDTTGTLNFNLTNFSTTGSVYVFDVSVPDRPTLAEDVAISTVSGTRSVRFSAAPAGQRKHYWAATDGTFRKPVMERFTPVDLRTVTNPPHMLIVCDERFRSAANRLKAYREANFPYFANPSIEVVSTQEVYDNFSGGLADPMAIRNYCKFLYDNFTDGQGTPALSFLLLLGDANTDYKNLNSSQPDFVPTNLNLNKVFDTSVGAYATDDWFVLLDPEDEVQGLALPDVPVGRLPAASVKEANFLVDRQIQYETSADFSPWRGQVVIVADDEKSPTVENQTMFVEDSEFICNYILPDYIDKKKVYLTEFPMVGNIKPGSRLQLLKDWNDGAVLVNFIGHGSSEGMADEQVFKGSDVGLLKNGNRLPLFMAMSCTIGDFDNPQGKCLAEKLVLQEGGGAIAAITSSQESLIDQNRALSYKVFAELFPDSASTPDPIGVVLTTAKVNAVPKPSGSQSLVENSQKYNLLGDPSLRLHSPRNGILLDHQAADTMTAGRRHVIGGQVYRGSLPDTGFKGRVYLTVREPDDLGGYLNGPIQIFYRYPRGVIFRGEAGVENGRFTFDFNVPRYPQLGPYVYITAYAEDGQQDAIITRNSPDFVLVRPAVADSIRPLDGPPRMKLGFKGGLTKVKPGAVLQAVVRDADGVNILSTTNEGRQALVLDNSNLPIDVTEYFTFDYGGSDTSGVMEYPLTTISFGKHRAIFKVGDSFGQTSVDTLYFSVTDPMDYSAQMVFNYPNPFSESTYFLFKLTDRAKVHLDIFTLSGRRIRTINQTCQAGEAWVYWEGRDGTGEPIANGVYLYVARVAFSGIDRPPIDLRGKVVKID